MDADLRPVVGYLEQQEPCRVKIQARNGGPTKSQLASALLDAANVHGANVVVDKHSNKLWNLFRNQGWKSSRSWHFVVYPSPLSGAEKIVSSNVDSSNFRYREATPKGSTT